MSENAVVAIAQLDNRNKEMFIAKNTQHLQFWVMAYQQILSHESSFNYPADNTNQTWSPQRTASDMAVLADYLAQEFVKREEAAEAASRAPGIIKASPDDLARAQGANNLRLSN